MWSRQADPITRTRARKIIETASGASQLRRLEVVAGSTLAAGELAVDDVHFRFVDGDFAFVGRSQVDYTHVTAENPDGETVYLALRDSSGATVETIPTPNKLAQLTRDFLGLVAGAEEDLLAGSDWYLLPVPEDLTPIIIETKDGDYMVSGVDFSAHRGYIATRDNPAAAFPSGVVRVVSGTRRTVAPHSFVIGAPTERTCGKYLAEYMRKTQSLSAFRRAAAEFCGMFVFQEADVVLSSHPVTDAMVYTMAGAGPVRIDYRHQPMTAGQEVQPGYAVAYRLELVTELSSGGPIDQAVADSGAGVSMDGVLPVKGISWTPGVRVLADYVEVSTSGTPHLRLHLHGAGGRLEEFWDAQKRHELATGVYLYDEIANGAESLLVDMDALLRSYYGPQLVLLAADVVEPTMYSRLMEFANDYKPSGVVLLTAVAGGIPPDALLDENGDPVLDEYGDYVLAY